MSAYHEAAMGSLATGLLPLENGSAQIGWGVGIFPIAIKEMYAALNEEERHTDLSPVSYTKVVGGQACAHQRQVMMYLPLPMFSDRWWVTTQGTNPAIRILSKGQMAELTWFAHKDRSEFSLDPQSESKIQDAVWVTESSGAWLLLRLDETHTLGEYHSWSIPSGYIPTSIASSFTAKGIKDIFDAMERYALQNEEFCQYTW